jgi:hypothetical protein
MHKLAVLLPLLAITAAAQSTAARDLSTPSTGLVTDAYGINDNGKSIVGMLSTGVAPNELIQGFLLHE